MSLEKYIYPEREKLKSRKLIKQVFEEGKTIKSYPLLVRFIETDEETHKVGVSVAKRNFKKAVDRNRIKRQLREAYRLNKEQLADKKSKYAVMIIFIGRKEVPTIQVMDKVRLLLKDIK